MNKLVKKHQKKLLAVFTAGLMVIFVMSSASSFNGGASDPVWATIGSEKLHAQEISDSRRLWDRLQKIPIANLPGERPGQMVSAASILGLDAVELISRDPDSFLLLQKEAQRMGLTASNDGVEELMQNQRALNEKSSTEQVLETRQAFTALLLVKAGYDRAVSVIKTPSPQKKYDAAMMGQSLKVNLITYDANEFKPAVPAPSADQLKAQFDKYANELADRPTETNPFGFGYKYPDRVKLEYLSVRREDLRNAVKKSKADADWELEARKQYIRNAGDYPTSRPSAPALPVGVAAPSTQPTTRPLAFADYRDQIVSQLQDAAEEKLLDDVRKKIASTMAGDWAAYKQAVNPTTKPTTQPAAGPNASIGVPYGSADYLPKLALTIQQEFKFLPQVLRFNRDWQTQKDLAGLPGLGSAQFETDFRLGGRPLPFPQYATLLLDALGHVPSSRDPAPTLSILSPAPGLEDDSRNLHFFRITAVDPAHAATDMGTFTAEVEANYKTSSATTQAKAAIDKLLPIAQSSGLDAAALSTGRKVQTIDRVTSQGLSPTKDLTLKPESERTLAKASLDLLKKVPEITAGRALAVVELPRDGKVMLISLAEVTPLWPAEMAYQFEAYFAAPTSNVLERSFRESWFDAKEVEKRLQYKSELKKEKSSS